jgi:hypothetical protein
VIPSSKRRRAPSQTPPGGGTHEGDLRARVGCAVPRHDEADWTGSERMFDEGEAAVTTGLVGHCDDSGNLIEHVVALPGEERAT